MSERERILSAIYDLYNAADHVSQLAQNAQVVATNGDYARAEPNLVRAEASASLIESHLRRALREIREGIANGTPAEEVTQ